MHTMNGSFIVTLSHTVSESLLEVLEVLCEQVQMLKFMVHRLLFGVDNGEDREV